MSVVFPHATLGQTALSLVMRSHSLVLEVLILLKKNVLKSLGFKLLILLVHHLLNLVASVGLRLKKLIKLILTQGFRAKPPIAVEWVLVEDIKSLL